MKITDAKPVILKSLRSDLERELIIADEESAINPENTDICFAITFKVSPNSIDRHLIIENDGTDMLIWHVKFFFTHNGFLVFRGKKNGHKRIPTATQIVEAIRGISE